MYTNHFGLKMLPFENVPDPTFFFDEGEHARVHRRIADSLKAGRGLIVITGPIGSGKTTLSQKIKSEFSNDIKLVWMALPPESGRDLFLFIAMELGLQPSATETVFILRDIKDALLKINSEGGRCLLIIDESHLMTDDTLNGIRLLNNLEEGSAKLIQILMLGQDELMEKIKKPEMEPFRQRIATLETIGKLNAEKRRHYISHRLQVAGGQPSIFSDTGWDALDLAFTPDGIPRLINSLCDRSLNIAFERGKNAVDVQDVYEAAQGMGLSKEIFHYMVALKSKERKEMEPSNGKNVFDEENKTVNKISEPLIKKEFAGRGVNLRSKTFQPLRDRAGIDFPETETALKRFRRPAVIILSAIVALLVGIFLYCQISGSSDMIICLLDLFGL